MDKPDTNPQADLFLDGGAVKPPRKAPRKKCAASTHNVTCSKCQAVYFSVHDVAARYNVIPSTIWRWLKTVPDFPAPIKLTPGTTRWRLSDLASFESKRGLSIDNRQQGGK